MKTKLLIEQHFHGAFGIDFNKASVDEILYLSKEILKYGIGGIFPTIVTDSIENTKHAIKNIKEASQKQTSDMAKIFGIHLEGIFINPEKKGIHNPKHFLAPTIENYKLIEDDFIKIVTLAPELVTSKQDMVEDSLSSCLPTLETSDNNISTSNLINYLTSQDIKVQAGHCTGGDLKGCSGVTHLFNAMSGITHRGKSTALSALIDDDIFTEIIADGVHVSDDALNLLFRAKPLDKIILISDCLPCTKADTNIDKTKIKSSKFTFADEIIYYDGKKATSKEGTLAGSTTLLPEIIKRLAQTLKNDKSNTSNQQIFKFVKQLIINPYTYHNINLEGSIEWDENWNILKLCNN